MDKENENKEDDFLNIKDENENEELKDKGELDENKKLDNSEELERLKKENETLKQQKTHWRNKAETNIPKEKNNSETNDLTNEDLFALMNAKIAEEDIDTVKKFAEIDHKGSIKEALQSDEVKLILNSRIEKRATADAMNTNSKRKSIKSSTDAEVMDKASKGEIPEAGTPEAEQLYRARRGISS